jgi:hypothetical protein
MDEKKARRLRFWRRAVLLQLFIITAILVTGVAVGYSQLNKMKMVKISKKDEDLGITKKTAPPKVKNEENKDTYSSYIIFQNNMPNKPKIVSDRLVYWRL